MSRLDRDLDARLGDLERRGLLRERARAAGASGASDRPLRDVCTNDYLGYARRAVSRETLPSVPAGAGASRLIWGTHEAHLDLEREVADWVGAEDALLFTSGYAANLGAIAALVGPADLVVSDLLNHASLIDACRLSRAQVAVVPHLDLGAVARALDTPVAGRRWVVTESYFSMDGDSPDISALRTLCDAAGAGLIVDEAHALGVFGSEGSGLVRAARVSADCLIGTLGKAVGVQGAFVAGSRTLATYLWNRARPFVFSTAMSPALTVLALDSVRRVRRDDAARARLAAHVRRIEGTWSRLPGAAATGRHGPIFPVLLGPPERALRAAALLRVRGFLAQAIRPPTVPADSSRLRIALHADLSEADVDALGEALLAACNAS